MDEMRDENTIIDDELHVEQTFLTEWSPFKKKTLFLIELVCLIKTKSFVWKKHFSVLILLNKKIIFGLFCLFS